MVNPDASSSVGYSFKLNSRSINQNVKKFKNDFSTLISRIFQNEKNRLGRFIGKQITGVKLDKKEVKKYDAEKKELIEKHGATSIAVESKEGTFLDGFILTPPVESKKWVVVFNGVGGAYEYHLPALQRLAEDVNANILTFNYRGVCDSTGLYASSASELMDDGVAILQFLKDQDVPEEDILIYGHSMGGGVAAEVHAKLEHQGPFISESSFTNFIAAAQAKQGKVMAKLLKSLNWELNGLNAIQQMKGQKKAIIVNRRDPTIDYKNSLYKHAKRELDQESLAETERVKIGVKVKKESFEPKVKMGKLHQGKEAAPKKAAPTSEDNYKKELKAVKKLHKHFPDPHYRIMYRRLDQTSQTALLQRDQLKLSKFTDKFSFEDELAYSKVVSIFKNFLYSEGAEAA